MTRPIRRRVQRITIKAAQAATAPAIPTQTHVRLPLAVEGGDGVAVWVAAAVEPDARMSSICLVGKNHIFQSCVAVPNPSGVRP
jgi:hypothetical protein